MASIKKIVARILLISIATLALGAVAVYADTDPQPYPYPEPTNDEGSANHIAWRTEAMLGTLPSNAPIRLHEMYTNTIDRYKLDYPKDYATYDKPAWWNLWGKTMQWVDENFSFDLDTIMNLLANGAFFCIKIMSTINILLIQLTMGGEWLSGLFSLFAAITKVIGVAFLVQNFFYISMLCLGTYLIFEGLIRRRLGTTVSELVLSLFLLAFTVYFVSNPAGVMRGINDTTDALGVWVMQLGTSKNVMEQVADAHNNRQIDRDLIENDVTSPTISDLKKNAIVDITNKLWVLQVHAPWEIMQFGTIDVDMSNPTRSTGKVVMSATEFAALKELLDNYDLNVTTSNGVVKASEGIVQLMQENGVRLVQPNTLEGVPWSTLILSIPPEQKVLREVFVSVLGTKGEGQDISTHPGSVSALRSTEAKLVTTLFMVFTILAMTWFIIFICAGMLMAQLIVLVSMLIGPFVLMASAVPKFGHRYVKNWALITLGAYGAKLIYYIIMALMFLLMSVIMTIAYDMNSLDLDEETRQTLSFFNGTGPWKLLIVHILVLLVMLIVNIIRKKMFVRHGEAGQFGLAGQIIHNTAMGKIKDTPTMYSRAMRGERYEDLVERRTTSNWKFNASRLPAYINPLNIIGRSKPKPADHQGSTSGGNDGKDGNDNSLYSQITNHSILKDNKYLLCPVDQKPCTSPQVGIDGIGACPKYGECPFHKKDDPRYGRQLANIRKGADKFIQSPSDNSDDDNGNTGSGNVGDNGGQNYPVLNDDVRDISFDSHPDVEFDGPESNTHSTSGKSQGANLGCPIDNGTCRNLGVALGDKDSPYCSLRGSICPYRNIADADHYNFMQQYKKKQSASAQIRISPQSANAPQNIAINMPIRRANTPEVREQTTTTRTVNVPVESGEAVKNNLSNEPNNRSDFRRIEVPEIHLPTDATSVRTGVRIGDKGANDGTIHIGSNIRNQPTTNNQKNEKKDGAKKDDHPDNKPTPPPRKDGNNRNSVTDRSDSSKKYQGSQHRKDKTADKVADSNRKYQEFRRRKDSTDHNNT